MTELSSFNVQVFPCKVAQDRDVKYGTKSYADSDGLQECAIDYLVDEYIESG